MIACYLAGADIVDVATDSMSGVTSQPSMGAVLNSLPISNHDFNQEDLFRINNYWEQVRPEVEPTHRHDYCFHYLRLI